MSGNTKYKWGKLFLSFLFLLLAYSQTSPRIYTLASEAFLTPYQMPCLAAVCFMWKNKQLYVWDEEGNKTPRVRYYV
jgi:hypothetical protein